jgi:AcrR family transcriptional regulator
MDALTARNIAEKAGCSTQPIYKIYANLDALRENVIRMAEEYCGKIIFGYDKTNNPFLDAGLAFIHFAATEKVLFRTFTTENYLKLELFGPLQDERLRTQMDDLLGDSPFRAEERQSLFLDVMIYTNGLAHLAYSGQLGMTEEQTAQRLNTFFSRMSGSALEGKLLS